MVMPSCLSCVICGEKSAVDDAKTDRSKSLDKVVSSRTESTTGRSSTPRSSSRIVSGEEQGLLDLINTMTEPELEARGEELLYLCTLKNYERAADKLLDSKAVQKSLLDTQCEEPTDYDIVRAAVGSAMQCLLKRLFEMGIPCRDRHWSSAALAGNEEGVRALLAIPKLTPPPLLLHDACRGGKWAVARILVDEPRLRGYINAQDEAGNTALHHAVSAQALSVVRLLMDRGALANVANAEGRTALHAALAQRPVCFPLAEFLICRGAPADVRTARGWSALHELVYSPETPAAIAPESSSGPRRSSAAAHALSDKQMALLTLELLERGAPTDLLTDGSSSDSPRRPPSPSSHTSEAPSLASGSSSVPPLVKAGGGSGSGSGSGASDNAAYLYKLLDRSPYKDVISKILRKRDGGASTASGSSIRDSLPASSSK
eukprot:tig00000133_g7714.t1